MTFWFHTRGIRFVYWLEERLHKARVWAANLPDLTDVVWKALSWCMVCPDCKIEYGYGHRAGCKVSSYFKQREEL
jgi:hypothetical protein